MTHRTTGMAGVKGPTESLGLLVRRVQDTGKVANDNHTVGTPLLNSKVLNVNVAGARGRLVLVDNVNSSTVVNMKLLGARGEVLKFLEDEAEIFRGFGSMNGGDELSLGGAGGTDALELGFVNDSATSQSEDITGDGTTCLTISSVRSIDVANESTESREGENAEVIRERRGWFQRDVREVGTGIGAPIEDAPVTSAAKVFANALEGRVMVLCGSGGKTRQERGSINNVGAADDISIRKFTDDLAKGVADFGFESTMGRSAFSGTGR